MGIIGVRCVLGVMSMEDHKKCMLTPDHACGYSEDTLDQMTSGNKERISSGVRYSPSSLQGCQRQGMLQINKDYYLDVDQSWPLFRGNLAHALYESLPPWEGILGTVREFRFATPINTKHSTATFMGKADLIVLKHIEGSELHIKVVDYKSKGEIGHDLIEADPKHVNQVNLYAWVASKELHHDLNLMTGDTYKYYDRDAACALEDWMSDENGTVVVDELEIVYIDMKRSRRFITGQTLTTRGRMTKRTYPREYETLYLSPVPLKRPASIENWLRIHIERQQDIELSGQLAPPIEGEGAWVCRTCPVLSACVDIGSKEGYDMKDQVIYDRE